MSLRQSFLLRMKVICFNVSYSLRYVKRLVSQIAAKQGEKTLWFGSRRTCTLHHNWAKTPKKDQNHHLNLSSSLRSLLARKSESNTVLVSTACKSVSLLGLGDAFLFTWKIANCLKTRKIIVLRYAILKNQMISLNSDTWGIIGLFLYQLAVREMKFQLHTPGGSCLLTLVNMTIFTSLEVST